MRTTALCFAVSLLAAVPVAHAQGNPPSSGTPTAATGARQVITSAEQLPRRTVKLDKLPSQYLDAPRAEVLTLGG
jgi:acetyl-CoA acetyltransferase